jgi:hypothetical protein
MVEKLKDGVKQIALFCGSLCFGFHFFGMSFSRKEIWRNPIVHYRIWRTYCWIRKQPAESFMADTGGPLWRD